MKVLAKQRLAQLRVKKEGNPVLPQGWTSAEADKFLDDISAAICSAWAVWQASATLVGVFINGPVASGGRMIGPSLTPLILAVGPKGKLEMKLADAVATVIGSSWLTFTETVKVSALPWYPSFAALPMPVAPPTPNIPSPFIALTMAPTSITATVLKSKMAAISSESGYELIFDAISDAFEKSFHLWKVSTMVTNVIGSGTVPSFAPPYVPVGPVIAGVGTMTPGGLI